MVALLKVENLLLSLVAEKLHYVLKVDDACFNMHQVLFHKTIYS